MSVSIEFVTIFHTFEGVAISVVLLPEIQLPMVNMSNQIVSLHETSSD